MIELISLVLLMLPHQKNSCPKSELVCLVQLENSFQVINQSENKINLIFKVEKIENIKMSLVFPSAYEIPAKTSQKIIYFEKNDDKKSHQIEYDWWWKVIR